MTSAAPDATFTIRRGDLEDAEQLAALAAVTFPLACPPETTPENIALHIAQHLGPAQFQSDLQTDGIVFYLLEVDDELAAYAMLVRGTELDVDPELSGIDSRNPVELRRIYVAPQWQRTGVARALMDRCIFHARTHGYDTIWLGTNEANERAMAFYVRKGFLVVGERDFTVGEAVEHDHVLARWLEEWPPPDQDQSKASVDVRAEIVVNRPLPAVAAYMFNPAHESTWTAGITDSRPDQPGVLSIGSVVERDARFLWRTFTYTYRVTDADPETFVEMTVEKPFPMVVRYDLAAHPDGTKVSIRSKGSPGGFFAFAAPLMELQVKRGITSDLKRLKAHLEDESA